ncbi:MAG: DUF4129 domain-containing protein [Planctomycetaceae bacterium]|nr:DUF4129 domain-containing protein [Planctomycetaceae bacterium]
MLSLTRVLCLICFCWASHGSLLGQDDPRLQGQALKRGTDPVWADIKQEDVQYGARPLVRDDLESRDRWADDGTSRGFWSWLFGSGNSGRIRTSTGGGSSGSWRGFWDWFFFLLYYGFLVFLAGALIAGFIWLLKSQEFFWVLRRHRPFQQTEDLQAQQAKYSDLPVELERGLLGLKAQAAALRDQGDYSKAIVYLFSYLLVELDTARCIVLSKGKTNYRYLRELARNQSLQTRLQRVVMLFEECYFGRRKITKQQFDSLWDDLPSFEEEIKRAANLVDDPSASVDSRLVGAIS